MPLTKIGCFHYGNPDKSNPIGSLEDAIHRGLFDNGEHCLKDSLIVLPEAFNLLGEYKPSAGYNLDHSIPAQLNELAGRYGAAFVAGIIDKCPVLPYSSAYLITKAQRCRLARKVRQDSLATGRTALYRGCDQFSEVCNTPTVYDQITVAALICMDAFEEELRKTLSEKLCNRPSGSVIVCVPARTTEYNTARSGMFFPNFHFVLSNSGPTGTAKNYPSIVRVVGGDAVPVNEEENKIVMRNIVE
jgi:hypothetical protein